MSNQSYTPQLLHSHNKITWKINNFSPSLLDVDSRFWSLDSPIIGIQISTGDKNRYTTQNRYFKLNIGKNRSCISLFIRSVDGTGAYNRSVSEKEGILEFEMGLAQRYYGNHLYHPTSGKFELNKLKYNHHRLGRLINHSEMMSGEASAKFYPTKKNEISIVLKLFYIEKNFNIPQNHSMSTENKEEIALSTQYEQMFKSEKYSDFTIITSDGERIPVHRNILSARSVVFDAMLQTNMKENEDNTALIKDIDGKSLTEFLRFLYCGKVQDFKEIAGDLLYAANKYELKDLKPLCVRSLCFDLDESNVLDTILIANLHSEDSLKNVCFSFIKLNYEKIKNDEMWKEIPSKLVKEILDHVIVDYEASSNVIEVSTNYGQPIRSTHTTATVNPAPPTVPVNVGVNVLADAIANRMRILNNPDPVAAPNRNNQHPPV